MSGGGIRFNLTNSSRHLYVWNNMLSHRTNRLHVLQDIYLFSCVTKTVILEILLSVLVREELAPLYLI